MVTFLPRVALVEFTQVKLIDFHTHTKTSFQTGIRFCGTNQIVSAIRLKGGEKTKFSPGLLTTFSSYEIFILMRQSFCMFSQRWPDLFLYKRSSKGGHAHFLYVLQEVARIFCMFSQRWARLFSWRAITICAFPKSSFAAKRYRTI